MTFKTVNTRAAKMIFDMLVAGAVISFVVGGGMVFVAEHPRDHVKMDDALSVVKADRAPFRLPPG